MIVNIRQHLTVNISGRSDSLEKALVILFKIGSISFLLIWQKCPQGSKRLTSSSLKTCRVLKSILQKWKLRGKRSYCLCTNYVEPGWRQHHGICMHVAISFCQRRHSPGEVTAPPVFLRRKHCVLLIKPTYPLDFRFNHDLSV